MAKFVMPQVMKVRTLWALWAVLMGGAVVWLLVGSVAYWVREGWLPEDSAGWAQALGSILAVAVAIAVPAWQRSNENAIRRKEQRDREITAYFQLSHLVVEVRTLLIDKGSYTPDSEITAQCLTDILGRLNGLTGNSFDRLLLKLSLDFRICILGFLRLVNPVDQFNAERRSNLLHDTEIILTDVENYIATVEREGPIPIGVS